MLHWVVADEELVDFADIHPPTFGATCPSSPLAVYAERGLFSAEVNWTEPAATDNSGILPTVTSNHQPLQRFNQGTHVITYTAVDQSGNTATCNFTIDVIGKNDTNSNPHACLNRKTQAHKDCCSQDMLPTFMLVMTVVLRLAFVSKEESCVESKIS